MNTVPVRVFVAFFLFVLIFSLTAVTAGGLVGLAAGYPVEGLVIGFGIAALTAHIKVAVQFDRLLD